MRAARAACVVVTLLAACHGSAPAHTAAAPRAPIQLAPGDVSFRPAPPNMPAGVQLAVLEGDPKQSGLFSVRMKLPAGFVLAPHTHPEHERVTVLEGAVAVGFGQTVERASLRGFEAGSYYLNPAGVAHYVLSDQGATLQITGMGPWQVDFLATPSR